MAYANWILTILAVITLIFAIWPSIAGAEGSKWIIVIAAIIVLIVTWTCVKCKYCGPKK